MSAYDVHFSRTCFQLAKFALVGVFVLIRTVAAADDLDAQYQAIAKDTLKKLRAANIQSTGVLKFSVRVGEGPFPKSVGSLNLRLAEKLELALVMANPAQESQIANQVGIVRGASDVANSIDGANHLTPNGRKLLFSKSYPLAWIVRDESSIVPDSLIVGVAQVHADLRNMDVELQLLTKKDLQLQPLATLTVPTDLEDLIDSGESFTTRGIFDDGSVQESGKKVELIVQKSFDIRQETTGKLQPQVARQHPLAPSSNSPIQFEVWYDNQRQPIEFREGAAFMKEPREGQKVIFIVTRNGADQKRYGVLVRVNGENTLYRERTPDSRASIWILEPSLTKFSIQGFQLDKGTRQDFQVLSDRESQKRTIDYGRDIGLISIVVYQTQSTPIPSLSDDQLDLAVLSQAQLPSKTAVSRGQLGKSLFDQLMAQDSTRGLIAEGQTKAAAINTVTFDRDPIPVMATSIRYYAPR
jgi:hypothetical protein